MASTISAGTTSGTAIAIAGDTSGALALQTNNGTTAVTINTAQGAQFLNTIGVGNATPSTSGAGISFPATQSASTDANTLDDYEEGNWTVTLTCGTSGSVTLGNKLGRYVKVGSLVSITMYIDFSAVSSPSGKIILNLPFTVANLTQCESAVSCFFGNVSSTNIINFIGNVNNGAATIDIFLGNSTGVVSSSANQLTASSNFRLSAHYMTA